WERGVVKAKAGRDGGGPGAGENLVWGHVREAGRIEPSTGRIVYGNLKPLKDALTLWAKGEPGKRWNLCDSHGEPIDWVADGAVQTLSYWHEKGQLPKPLRWKNANLFRGRRRS